MVTESIKPGYKQTEVGVIPEDWEIDNLGHFVKIRSGESPSKFMILDSGVPYFKVEQLNNSMKYQKQTPYFIDIVNPVKSKSLIFPKRGEAIYQNKIRILAQDSYMDTNLMTITVDPELDYEYLFYFLSKRGLSHIADTTSVPQINNKHIIPFKIVYPKSKLEQNAIATALSDTDALIQSLERLIAKKREIKQGAMQELLTGKKRLPGFEKKKGYKQTEVGVIPEDWGVTRISEVGEVRGRVGWRGYAKRDLTESGPYVIGAKHIDSNYRLDLSDATHLSMEKYMESPEIMVQCNDILIVQRGTIGKLVIIDTDIGDATINPSMVIVRLNVMNKYFSYYFFLSTPGQCQILSDTSSTGVPMITQERIGTFVIPFPALPEQIAIATALTDMDAEIGALDSKLAKARQIKEGMMQELLTGRIRLT